METKVDEAAEIRLGRYGRMAIEHWRRWLPKMTATLEATGELESAAAAAREQTMLDMMAIEEELQKAGHSPGQANVIAWEMVRERYILLEPEPGVE